jgi:hypothetical protein
LGAELFGSIKFWIAGQGYGVDQESANLRASARWAKRFLASAGERSRPELDDASTEDAFEELYGKFVGRKNASRGPWNRDPFVLDEIGDASVRDMVAVVAFRCSNNEDRVIVKSLELLKMAEVRLPGGELDDTIRSFCAWVDAQNT